MHYKTISADVLVIGSGAAGLRAAIEAKSRGADVLVIGKSKMGDAHTGQATGGINAALGTMDPQDSWLLHAADTLKEGGLLADHRTVETLCQNGPRAIQDLLSYGCKFHTEANGKLTQRFFGAHTYRRTCFYGDQTGKEILRSLVFKTKHMSVRFMESIYVTKLLKNGGRVVGALGLSHNGNFFAFLAKSVILAGGGYTRIYKRSSSRIFENTGDGVTLAYEAGADLQDMEMVQFHPTGMVWPLKAEGVLVTEAVRGEGGILFNAKNERFMSHYSARAELGPRDVVARAIYSEIQKGKGTKHGGVWLDITNRPKSYILKRLPKVYRQFQDYLNVDISRQRVEVAPTAHYSMGGVAADQHGRTSVPGLYAVGEVTGGVHGANRLGGNSLLECIAFGRIVGEHAAVNSKDMPEIEEGAVQSAIAEVTGLLGKPAQDIKKLREQAGLLMWRYAGIVRNGHALKKGLKEIESLRKKVAGAKVWGLLKNNGNLIELLDLKNMLIPCEAVLRAALYRKESRGAHFREDHTHSADSWLVNVLCKKSGGMVLSTKNVVKPQGPIMRYLKKPQTGHKMLE